MWQKKAATAELCDIIGLPHLPEFVLISDVAIILYIEKRSVLK